MYRGTLLIVHTRDWEKLPDQANCTIRIISEAAEITLKEAFFLPRGLVRQP